MRDTQRTRTDPIIHPERDLAALDAVELIPSRLYVLGGRIRLDSTVSWAPDSDWGRGQPINSYLLREGDAALMIDPGPFCHEDVLLEQLTAILPPGSPITVFVTRAEFECFGSLGKVAEAYEIEHIYAGGATNPFDGFDNLTNVDPSRTEYLHLGRVAPGAEIALTAERRVKVISPSIRLLVTYWVFDPATETLFTSDTFAHGTTADDREGRVMGAGEGYDADAVRRHLYSKVWWLPYAKETAPGIAAGLQAMFDQYPISTIAPARGKLIHGRDAVLEHYGLVQDVLAEIAAS